MITGGYAALAHICFLNNAGKDFYVCIIDDRNVYLKVFNTAGVDISSEQRKVVPAFNAAQDSGPASFPVKYDTGLLPFKNCDLIFRNC